MLIKIGCDISFELQGPTPMVAMLYVHPSRQADLRAEEKLHVTPEVAVHDYIDSFGNRCARFLAPGPGLIELKVDCVIEDSGKPDREPADTPQHRIEDLPDDCLTYLMPSRYCEVDKLSDIAWNLFGNIPGGWPRVQAICTWVNRHITFGYHLAHSSKSAWDVYQKGEGVCRDFNHLAVTFCRCMNIPARYVTGYLGDIGVPLAPNPMDYSAWFQVYLGDRWVSFDARHDRPRIGRILMAAGRDAADVALTTNFGSARLEKFVVITDEVPVDGKLTPIS